MTTLGVVQPMIPLHNQRVALYYLSTYRLVQILAKWIVSQNADGKGRLLIGKCSWRPIHELRKMKEENDSLELRYSLTGVDCPTVCLGVASVTLAIIDNRARTQKTGPALNLRRVMLTVRATCGLTFGLTYCRRRVICAYTLRGKFNGMNSGCSFAPRFCPTTENVRSSCCHANRASAVL